MSKPKRIQLRRTNGWRKPPGAVVVGRPSRWGNPYTVGHEYQDGRPATPQDVVDAFRHVVATDAEFRAEIRHQLRGKDLCCWCPLDQPCHADVLLEVANA